MKKNLTIIIVFTCCIGLFSFSNKKRAKPAFSCKEVVLRMINAIADVKGLKYNLKITERTKGKFNYFSSSVKLNRNPRKLYLTTNGIEVLWTVGANKGDALVKPNSFPYMNLNLDPLGNLMRDGQHHTINEMGFDYFGNIVAYNVLKTGSNFDDYFKLEGEEILNGKPCYKFSINNPDFKFFDYTVLKGENLVSIARKLHVGEYMILENNKKVDGYKDVKAGQVIKVPTAYAKFVVIYLDKQLFLPVGSRISDDKGLYEQYDYFNLQLNPTFEENEFTRKFKGYGF
ncbi:MAG: LysM peptidoglycan-binding domain-containing protein [Bacteroidia bacterium]